MKLGKPYIVLAALAVICSFLFTGCVDARASAAPQSTSVSTVKKTVFPIFAKKSVSVQVRHVSREFVATPQVVAKAPIELTAKPKHPALMQPQRIKYLPHYIPPDYLYERKCMAWNGLDKHTQPFAAFAGNRAREKI